MLSIETFKNAAVEEIRKVGINRTWFSAVNKRQLSMLHFVVWTGLEQEVRVFNVNAGIIYDKHDFKNFIDETLAVLKANDINVALVLQDSEVFHYGVSCLALNTSHPVLQNAHEL